MTTPPLTALIPAHNDDYALWLCLRSIGPYFEEIIILDDYSIDATSDVVSRVRKEFPQIQYVREERTHLGAPTARERLLEMAAGEHLFFIDADDILCEYRADVLGEITELAPMVYLPLTELWGDFQHTTGRLNHYDVCHVYINRRQVRDLDWHRINERHSAAPWARGPGPLFWHMRGVKPDWRLVQREITVGWEADTYASRNAGDWSYDETVETLHAKALDRLFNRKQFPLQRHTGEPRLPTMIREEPSRFEIVYRDGLPVDRLDHGWWAGDAAPPNALFFETDTSLDRWDHMVPIPVTRGLLREDGPTYNLLRGGKRLARFSPSAAAVWSLVDGNRNVAEIKHLLDVAYYAPPGDVLSALRDMHRRRLIRLRRPD